jgi:hypothetical protein
MTRSTSRTVDQGQDRGQGRHRGRACSAVQRIALDGLDDRTSWMTGLGRPAFSPDSEYDETEDVDGDEEPVSADAEAGDDANEASAGLRPVVLSDLIGSRSPQVLVRLVRAGEGVRAVLTQGLDGQFKDALVELRALVQSRFDAAPALLGSEGWQRLLDPQTPLDERLLLLTRLAIRGLAKVSIQGEASFSPNNRGLGRYAGKFATLPDGLPFSLRLLLVDGQGKKKNASGEPSFNDLPDALQLRALRAALAREKQEGQAKSDSQFAGLLADVLRGMGIDLDQRTGLTAAHLRNLRDRFNYHNLEGLFPNRYDRQRAYRRGERET